MFQNPIQTVKFVRQFNCTKSLKNQSLSGCILLCCRSCAFCQMSRAPAKERVKSRCLKEQNKKCKKCFLCKSVCFCPACAKCPQCCSKSGCRGQVKKVLPKMARPRGKSKGGLNFERGLHASLQNETTSHKVTSGPEWLCKPGQ